MRQRLKWRWCLVGMLVLLPAVAFSKNLEAPKKAVSNTPVVMGYVESVHVYPGDLRMKAKLDSGAHTSSIRARILENFTKDDNEWIRFSIQDNQGHQEIIEKKVKRWVKIKLKEGGFLRRPVVVMEFCIGNLLLKGETNLATRENFIYPVLVGRNMLEGQILIDVAQHFSTKPHCKQEQEDKGQ